MAQHVATLSVAEAVLLLKVGSSAVELVMVAVLVMSAPTASKEVVTFPVTVMMPLPPAGRLAIRHVYGAEPIETSVGSLAA